MKKEILKIRKGINRLGKNSVMSVSEKKVILRALDRLEKKQEQEMQAHLKSQVRVDDMLEVVLRIARFDYSRKARITKGGDHLDALANGINMLGEELEDSSISLEEKESLLKEIHHRVKNNLQVISSLLSLQAATITDPDAHRKFMESCNRIRTMAIVHEKLYLGKDFSRISMDEYLLSLLKYLNSCYFQPEKRVEMLVDINVKKLLFKIDEAIPFGLILNELLTNAYKYAFPGSTKGKIWVSFTEKKNSKKDSIYCLQVRDNGCGLPPKLDVNQTTTLGLQLVTLLTEQLGGKLKIGRQGGASFQITFCPAKEKL